jgi:glycosyltransferase involved in cell wall biosynthesis
MMDKIMNQSKCKTTVENGDCKNANPTLSIIVPIYNAEKYLPECLESILSQTFSDFEVICVNDGSADDSANILAEFSARDPRIKIMDQRNSGPSVTRNNGMAAARGHYIGFVDADDTIDSDFYEKLILRAIDSDADVCATEVKRDGNITFITFSNTNLTTNDFVEKLSMQESGACWNKIYRHSMLKKHGIQFDASGLVGEDTPFLVRTAYYSRNYSFIGGTFYHYRKTPDSITTTSNEKINIERVNAIIYFCRDMINFVDARTNVPRERKQIRLFVMGPGRAMSKKQSRSELKTLLGWQLVLYWHIRKLARSLVHFFYKDSVSKKNIRTIKILKVPVYRASCNIDRQGTSD